MENLVTAGRRTLAFRYEYYDRAIDKEVVKSFTLPEIEPSLTHDQMFELIRSIATVIDLPSNAIVSGELIDRTDLYAE